MTGNDYIKPYSPVKKEAMQRKIEDPETTSSSLSGVSEEKMDRASALPEDEIVRLTDDIIRALKTVHDPEIPVDIYELGLIYRVDIDDDRVVRIDMTLTAPACPVAGEMPIWVEDAVSRVEGVCRVHVRMVFDPPWNRERMSDEARVALNMY